MKKSSAGIKSITVEELAHDSYKARFFYAGVYAMKRCGLDVSPSKSKNKSTDAKRK